MLTQNFNEFVTRGGKEQESGTLVFHVYSLPCWTKCTIYLCSHIDFSEQKPIAQNLIKHLHVSVYVNSIPSEAFISTINMTKSYLKSSRVQLVHILHNNL